MKRFLMIAMLAMFVFAFGCGGAAAPEAATAEDEAPDVEAVEGEEAAVEDEGMAEEAPAEEGMGDEAEEAME